MSLRKMEKKTSYLAFLDISKVNDSVWREGLWCKMRHYGVEEKFVKVWEGLYSGVETRVVMNVTKSRWFGVETCRKGCPLSPLLFNIYKMGIMEELERAQPGVKLGECWSGALMYADDIVLVAD